MKCSECGKEYSQFTLHISGLLHVGSSLNLTVKPTSTIDKSSACRECLVKLLAKDGVVRDGYIHIVED